MEEKKEELETSVDTEVKDDEMQASENGENVSADSEPKKQERPAANFGLLLLAGVYLLYTGYKLCENVLKGEEGASWGFLVAGIAFLVIGAGMLFAAAKTAKQRSDAKKAAAAEEEKENPVEQVQEPKRMTIAERAKLAGNVAEKEPREEQDPEEEKEKERDEDQE